MIKKILLTVALILVVLSCVGCQTIEGVGGDIQWTAQKTADVIEGN